MEWATRSGGRPRRIGHHDAVDEGAEIGVILREIVDMHRSGACGTSRPEPPCPRQSSAATAKPRPRNSSITSKYFSMNSVWPFSSAQSPRAGAWIAGEAGSASRASRLQK